MRIRGIKTSKHHEEWWAKRQIDWKTSYTDTWNHPHRKLVIDALARFKWLSLFEVGCGGGPNLVNIQKHFPKVHLGGADVNRASIAEAQKYLHKSSTFIDGPAHDLFLSDRSTDIVLSDMVLIYYGPRKIRKALKEIKRITRKGIVFVEFHSKNPLKRLALALASGYYAHNFEKLLLREGFYDVTIEKLKESDWPGGNPQKDFAYVITAKV